MRSKCDGQRKSLTVQLNSRPVRRIELVRKSVLLNSQRQQDIVKTNSVHPDLSKSKIQLLCLLIGQKENESMGVSLNGSEIQ